MTFLFNSPWLLDLTLSAMQGTAKQTLVFNYIFI